MERNIQDALVVNSLDAGEDEYSEDKAKQVEIIIPFKNNKYIPDFLVDFIQNDPSFIPEIYAKNLEDVMHDVH